MAVEFGGAGGLPLSGGTLTGIPNQSVLTVSGYSLTGSSNASLESWSGTLTTSGVVNVLDYQIIDTQHGTNSAFFRFRGGASGTSLLFQVGMDGAIFASTGTGTHNILGNSIFGPSYIGVNTSTVGATKFGSNVVNYSAPAVVGWSSTTDAAVAPDTATARNAAGVVEINNGTAGTFRDLIARNVRTNPTAVAGLVAAATAGAGARSFVTDATVATFGSAAVGGGANKMPVWCDGTGWFIG